MRRALLVFELPTPNRAIARWQLDLALERQPRFVNIAHQITTTRIGADDHHALSIFVLDSDRAVATDQRGDFSQRHVAAIGQINDQAREGLR